MSDVVVTVPKSLWLDWLEEGDLPGDPWGGDYWSFYTGGAFPTLIRFSGQRWSTDAFGPSRDDDFGHNSPGMELVWSQLADDDREWRIVSSDQRCYVVAHERLRGYALLFAVEVDAASGRLRAFIRKGGAVAVTIPEPIQGFRGWRYRWWSRASEVPFPDWKTAGVIQARRS